MAKLILPFLLLLFLGGLFAAMNESKVDVKIEVDLLALESGRVVLNTSIENFGVETVKFLPWNTPFDVRISGRFFDVVNVDSSKRLDYLGPMIKRVAPTEGDFIALAPGETRENRLDLTDYYSFCANNAYVVSYDFGGLFDGMPSVGVAVSAKFSTNENMPVCG